MAPSSFHAARLAAALSGLVSRRGYSAAAAPSAALRRAEEKAVTSTKSKKMGGGAESSWVPDPVTGYYRPANRTAEIDAAELRQRLLSRNSHH